MLFMLLSLSWILSMIFMFLKHPLSLGCILLSQTIIISITSGLLNLNFWFSYILFLIMIGGMLVLFIYMTSVASNEKFKFSSKISLLISIYLASILIMLFTDNFIFMSNSLMYDLVNQSSLNINLSMNKFMSPPMALLMILVMIYLLLTLIAIVKISESKTGTLRSNM